MSLKKDLQNFFKNNFYINDNDGKVISILIVELN
jgi:hypothetical protein